MANVLLLSTPRHGGTKAMGDRCTAGDDRYSCKRQGEGGGGCTGYVNIYIYILFRCKLYYYDTVRVPLIH